MLKETEFENLINEDLINEWETDPVVQNILQQIDFLDTTGGKVQQKTIPNPPKVEDRSGGCCG